MNEIEVRVRRDGVPYRRVRLTQSPASIGRDPEADVHLDSKKVSRIHAHIFFDGDGVRIVDADSRNGLAVDGEEQREATLTPSQTVSICEFTFRVRALAGEAPADEHPGADADVPDTAQDREREPDELDDAVSKGWSEGAAELDDDTSVGRRPQPEPPEPSASLSATEGEREGSAARPPADASADATNALEAGADEDDDDAPEIVPADAPSVLDLLRNTPQDLSSARGDRDVVLEVVVSSGGLVHEMVMLTPGQQYWWGGTPSFPRILWTVPTLHRFPLAMHERAGRYHVQVPQNSVWKMYRRGSGSPAVHRSGPLVGMRNERADQAEVSYGPYTIYMRMARAPRPLTKRFSIAHLLPTRLTTMGLAFALLVHVAFAGVRVRTPQLMQRSAPTEHFVEVTLEPSVDPLPPEPEAPPAVVETSAPPPEAEAAAPKPADEAQARIGTKKKSRTSTPGKPIVADKPLPAQELKQASISDFRVTGFLPGIPEPTIAPGKGPKLRGASATLRGSNDGQRGLVDKSGLAFAVTPPGRLERLEVQRVVNAHAREIGNCYNDGLDDNPQAAGRLELQWRVDAAGKVTDIRVLFDELGSPQTTRCMRDAVSRWQFPAPKGGPAVVSFPFRFANPKF